MPEGAASVARLLLYLGAVVMLGRATLAMVSPSLPITSTAASRVVLQGGVIALLLAPWMLLQLQLGALEMPWAEAPVLVRETGWGRGWIGVTVSALLSAVGLLLTLMRRTLGVWGTLLMLLSALLLAVTMGSLGHAAADARFPVLARVVDAAHVIGMGGWIGGLILTAVAVREGPSSRAVAAWRAFSRSATVLAPLALLTGMASSGLRLADAIAYALVADVAWPALMASRYTQLLVGKALVVLLVLGYGAVQRRRVQRAEVPPARAIVQEGVFAFVALVITAVLTGTEPPTAPE